MNLPTGIVTYHLPVNQFWDSTGDIIELEVAPVWDGHTSEDVIKRIIDWVATL
jgi:hypothetical protein